MIAIGVGCGPGLLTLQAIEALARSRTVYGSRRAIELAAGHLPAGCEVHELKDFSNLERLPEDAVLLSTGDPMLAGLGTKAAAVIPGISSLQLGCARLGISWERIEVISAHADQEDVIARTWDGLERGRVVFLLVAPGFDVPALAATLYGHGHRGRVAVLEQLGYPDERVDVGTVEKPPEVRSKLFSLFVGEW